MELAIKTCTESGDVIQGIAILNIKFSTLYKLNVNFSEEVKIGIL